MKQAGIFLTFLVVSVSLFAGIPPVPKQKLPDRYQLLVKGATVQKVGETLEFDIVASRKVKYAYLTAGVLPGPYAIAPIYRINSSSFPDDSHFKLSLNLKKVRHFLSKEPTLLYYRLNVVGEKGRPESFESRVLLDNKGNCMNTVVFGPYLDMPEEGDIVISFELNKAGPAALVVDGKRIPSQSSTLRHVMHLTGFKPGPHRYAIENDPREFHFTVGKGKKLRFVMMCDSRQGSGGAEYNLHGCNGEVIRKLFLSAWQHGASLILFPGDLVNGYTSVEDEFEMELKEWAYATEPISSMIPVYEGIGNHEALVDMYLDNPWIFYDKKIPHSTEDVFARVFVNPENADFSEKPGLPAYKENLYFFHRGNSLFIMLNTNYWVGGDFPELQGGNLEGHIMDRQMKWLERVLKTEGKKAEHIIVAAHEPAFPVSAHMDDGMYYMGGSPALNNGIDRRYVVKRRNELMSLLSRYGVQLIFFGDEHNYSRVLINKEIAPVTNEINQIVSGGTGAPFYELAKDIPWRKNLKAFSRENHYILVDVDENIHIRVIGISGRVLDKFTIKKGK
ncbi:MAG: hypothetical protein CO090_10425 [Acidobacteria bacterium CG_4_9_14_3_um_filter_49_7]|nr:MAG: hypothetical protein CO090_10425 [Acidobacteria bacterium CG_4_9_14_3_um_filter_49_7]